MITAEEERALIIRAKAGDTGAAGELLRAHEGFLCQIAKRFRGDLDDTMQEARRAALLSLRGFDLTRGYRFLTYASKSVVWHLQRARDNGGRTIRIPQSSNLKRLPRQLQRQARNARRLCSLDAPAPDGDTPRGRMVPGGGDVLEDVQRAEDVERVTAALGRLSTREQHVIRGRMDSRTLDTIGVELGLCRERVRQIEAEIHEKLRRELQERQDDDRDVSARRSA